MRLNIGQAAASSGVSAKMIRYYEATGLLAPAVRTESNYRTYGDDDVHALRFIRRSRDLGFSMEETAQLLALWRDRARSSAEVKAIAQAHVADLERRIRELEAMKRTLQTLAHACHGDNRPDCPILDDLATGAVPASPPTARPPRSGLRVGSDPAA